MHESGQQDPATFMQLKEFQSTLPDARPLAQLLEHAAKEFEDWNIYRLKIDPSLMQNHGHLCALLRAGSRVRRSCKEIVSVFVFQTRPIIL